MKGILTFNLPEEREDFQHALNGWRYKARLDEIWDKVFRPYHKHGYGEEIDKIFETEAGTKIFEELERRYREAIREYED